MYEWINNLEITDLNWNELAQDPVYGDDRMKQKKKKKPIHG